MELHGSVYSKVPEYCLELRVLIIVGKLYLNSKTVKRHLLQMIL
jgi:hypothetical protein